MTERSSRPLVLLSGDANQAVAGRAPARLEIDRGVVRRVGPDGRSESWDVSGCRLLSTPGDSLGVSAAHAFVTPSGAVRCWIDLAEWMPGVLHADPTAPSDGLGPWLQRVTDAVADAAGVRREKRGVAAEGPRIRASEARTETRSRFLQVAAATAAFGPLVVGLTVGSDALIALGGLVAIVLVLLTAVPRALWPRRRVRGAWRIRLAGPAGACPAELVGTGSALAHSTAYGVRRWIPLDGVTAPVQASLSPDTGRAVLEFRGAALDVSLRDPTGVPELARRLIDAGIRVRRVQDVAPTPAGPIEPSGLPGDARADSALGIGLILSALAGILLARTDAGAAVLPLAVAAGLGLLMALVAFGGSRALAAARR